MKKNLTIVIHFICFLLLFSSCNNANVEFKQIDKSKTTTTYNDYGKPINILSSDNNLIAEFSIFGITPFNLTVYFYIENKGGNGAIPIKINYSDDQGTKIEKTIDAELEESKAYKIKVTLTLGPALNDLNKIEITLPNGTKDDFSVRLDDGRGEISNIEVLEY